MKVSLNWIKEFVDVNSLDSETVDKLVAKIGAQLGAVEEVIDVAKKYRGIVIAEVVTCENHPNADKLRVCSIDDGGNTPGVKRDKGGLVQVVCGAPNVKSGMLVAWLPPGAVVPSTYDKEPLKLEAREIRGVVSNGMLASASELAISDDHSGILALNPQDAKPGDDFMETYKLDDHIIDIENKMFTHRPDLFGILGVAREIAGIQRQPFTSPEWYKDTPKLKSSNDLPLNVKIDDKKLIPRFMAVAMNIEQSSDPVLWLQTYLSRVGIRPINIIVDITNYLMHLTGQPLHAYDYDKVKALSGTAPTLIARESKKGETITLLGGKKIAFDTPAVVIATDKQAIGIGGVMGGQDTEVDENTQRIILECANFDMYSIRRTAMHYGLFTDAATRFTKGQSPLQNDRVLAQAVSMAQQLAKGQIVSRLFDEQTKLEKPIAVHVTDEFINARLGLKLEIKEMARLLQNVEFDVAINGPNLVVTPPFWRTDIEIPEDVVEEVGRLYGYDHLPLELPKQDLTPAKNEPLIELKRQIREILAAAGANEVLNYSFVHGNLLDKVGQDKEKAFRLSNALSPDLQYYRLSLTPSLLEKVHLNIKAGHNEFAIFELGKKHQKGFFDEEKLPSESEVVALVFTADDKAAKQRYSGATYYQARKYLEQMIGRAGKVSFEPLNEYHEAKKELTEWLKPYEPTRSSMVLLDGKVIGPVGEFRVSVRQHLKLPDYTAGFELGLQYLLGMIGQSAYSVLSKFPKVEQDISLKVPAELTYGELYDFMKQTVEELKPRETMAGLQPLDIYQRKDDKKHKQITLRLNIASYERTLTDQEVNSLLDDVSKAAHQKFGAIRI